MDNFERLEWHSCAERPPRRLDLVVDLGDSFSVVLGDEELPRGVVRWAPVPRTFLLPLEASAVQNK